MNPEPLTGAGQSLAQASQSGGQSTLIRLQAPQMLAQTVGSPSGQSILQTSLLQMSVMGPVRGAADSKQPLAAQASHVGAHSAAQAVQSVAVVLQISLTSSQQSNPL
jgi:hypothetical protein